MNMRNPLRIGLGLLMGALLLPTAAATDTDATPRGCAVPMLPTTLVIIIHEKGDPWPVTGEWDNYVCLLPTYAEDGRVP